MCLSLKKKKITNPELADFLIHFCDDVSRFEMRHCFLNFFLTNSLNEAICRVWVKWFLNMIWYIPSETIFFSRVMRPAELGVLFLCVCFCFLLNWYYTHFFLYTTKKWTTPVEPPGHFQTKSIKTQKWQCSDLHNYSRPPTISRRNQSKYKCTAREIPQQTREVDRALRKQQSTVWWRRQEKDQSIQPRKLWKSLPLIKLLSGTMTLILV